MIMNPNGSRFVLMEKPLVYPQADMVTNAPEGPVFDLNVDLDNLYGVAYLKVEHVEEMAHTLGMLTKEDADKLLQRINDLEEENAALPEHVEELVNGIADLVSSYRNGPPASGSDGISVPVYLADKDLSEDADADSSKSADASGDNSGEPDELDELIGNTSGQVSKSAKLKGPNNVPADSSDEFGFGDSGTS